MESKDTNYIEIEVNSVIEQLDANQMLSSEDRLELKDHFLNEIDRLVDSGLNDEEAFLIAKKRFGAVEEIKQEYKKVKPQFDILRYGIIGVVAYCLIKSYFLLVNLSSQMFWLIYYQFDPVFVRKFAVLDIPLRLFLVFLIGYFAGKLITKVNIKNLFSMWMFPIFYLLMEVLTRLYGFVIPMGGFASDIELVFELFTNSWIINTVFLVFVMIFSSYKMYKLRVWDMEYV